MTHNFVEQTEIEARFAHGVKQLYHNPNSTDAIRCLDRLVGALSDIKTHFPDNCPTSRQFISDTLGVMNPYSTSAPTMAPAFKAAARKYKLERGHRQLKSTPTPTKPTKPTLRRTVSV